MAHFMPLTGITLTGRGTGGARSGVALRKPQSHRNTMAIVPKATKNSPCALAVTVPSWSTGAIVGSEEEEAVLIATIDGSKDIIARDDFTLGGTVCNRDDSEATTRGLATGMRATSMARLTVGWLEVVVWNATNM
mmetsp:Transcript_70177/g.117782  ORF Transcript_70177/g.117782 Transcript_70177/m.117782 type:complete len:135 (+) Transcript_70177:1273-1677(+)